MAAPVSHDINRWIVRASLAGDDEVAIVNGACERLIAAGVPLLRVALAGDMLDPSYDSASVRWRRGQGAVHQTLLRSGDAAVDTDWLASPFHRLVHGDVDRMRRRLDATYRAGEFPVLDEFRAQGGTDYFAMIVRLGEGLWLGDTRGVVSSWLTDASAGFDEDGLELIAATLPALSNAAYSFPSGPNLTVPAGSPDAATSGSRIMRSTSWRSTSRCRTMRNLRDPRQGWRRSHYGGGNARSRPAGPAPPARTSVVPGNDAMGLRHPFGCGAPWMR